MSEFKNTRRQFILNALGGYSLFLAGCSSIDSVFTLKKKIFREETLIIGGGAAGLYAAYLLKKQKRPFHLFEGGQRLGGRAYTAYISESIGLDLGAEFFRSSDLLLQLLLKEFSLKPQPWKPLESIQWKGDSGFQEAPMKGFAQGLFPHQFSEVRRDLYDIKGFPGPQKKIRWDRASYYDSLSVEEFLELFQGEKGVGQRFLQQQALHLQWKYGAPLHKISSLHFIEEYLGTMDTQEYFLPLGLGELFRLLGLRVAGPVPEHFVKFQWNLKEIGKTPIGWELVFKTPNGEESVFAQNVILAIPPKALLRVKGFESAIQNQSGQGDLLKKISTASFIKTARPMLSGEPVETPWLKTTSTESKWLRPLAGAVNFEVSLKVPSEQLKEAKNQKSLHAESLYSHWGRDSKGQAGSFYFEVGSYENYLKFSGDWGLPEQGLFLAGDFTASSHLQSVEGALISGHRVVEEVKKR